MRSRHQPAQDVLDTLRSVAQTDPRIRAAYFGGSRVDPAATQDHLSDFDVVYLVNDLPALLQDQHWLDPFGEPLIVQRPDDWFTHPYEYTSRAPFALLMYFRDGHRIDLTLVDLSQHQVVLDDPEPRHVLLDKDGLTWLTDIPAGRFGRTFPPTERQFVDSCNEFWWCSLGAAKGLVRGEVLSAKMMIERYQLDMLLAVMGWQAGQQQGFPLALGKFSKYLPRFLKPDDSALLMDVLCARTLPEQWTQLMNMCALFDDTASQVAASLQMPYDSQQAQAIMMELHRLKAEGAELNQEKNR